MTRGTNVFQSRVRRRQVSVRGASNNPLKSFEPVLPRISKPVLQKAFPDALHCQVILHSSYDSIYILYTAMSPTTCDCHAMFFSNLEKSMSFYCES